MMKDIQIFINIGELITFCMFEVGFVFLIIEPLNGRRAGFRKTKGRKTLNQKYAVQKKAAVE